MLQDIFRAYDIRALYHQLTPELAGTIASKLIMTYEASYSGPATTKRLIIGTDCRAYSTKLAGPIISIFSAAGWQIEFISQTITPVIYYLDAKKQSNIAIMLTASHNSEDYCGLKIQFDGKPFCGHELANLGRDVIKELNMPKSIEYDYSKAICANIKLGQPLDICFICPNQALSTIIDNIGHKLGLNYVICRKTPKTTQKFGLILSFDEDGDRLLVFNQKGKLINGDVIFYLFAQDVLQKSPGTSIVIDVKSSRYLFNRLRLDYGANIVISRTGHSFIKQLPANIKGEMSGHYYFSDRYYGFDDGLYAALRLIELVSCSPMTLDEMIKQLPQYPSTPEIHLQLASECDKFSILKFVKQIAQGMGLRCSELDGVTITLPAAWLLIRPSNTEEILVLRAEGQHEAALAEALNLLAEILTETGLSYENTELATCLQTSRQRTCHTNS